MKDKVKLKILVICVCSSLIVMSPLLIENSPMNSKRIDIDEETILDPWIGIVSSSSFE